MSDKKSRSKSHSGKRKRKSSSRESLYQKREQLLEEMQSTEDNRAISVREQVEKLKAGGSDGEDEDRWGDRKSRKSGSPWMLWVILGLVIPILLVGLILMSKNGNARGGANGETGLDFDTLSGGSGKVAPEDWFVTNSGEAFSRSLEILEVLNQESLTLEEVQPLVRSSGQAEQLIAMNEAGKWSGFDLSDPTKLRWGYGSSGESGFMFLEGVRKDFRDFRVYFVRDGEELLLDVEASEVVSDIPVNGLAGETLVGDALVRCWLAKEPNFDARSDQKLYSWYQILGPNKVDFVWAYCKAGSAIDEALRKELNYGRVIGDRKDYIRTTVMLGNATDFRDDEFLLKEILADEWVLPTVE